MLLYVVGAPRSGKSYYAVDYIARHHKDVISKNVDGEVIVEDKYSKVLTNIGGFKHEILPNAERLNLDNLDLVLKELHKLFKNNKNESNVDDILIDYLKSVDMYKVLLVVDEAHNYFDKRLVHLIFFLSYHGHLGFDILLITQNLGLIDSKYKAFAEYFIKALPTTMRITQKNFRYLLFTCSGMTKNCQFSSETIKFNVQVFNLYKSGDVVKTKSMFRNIFIGLSILLSAMVYFFYTSPMFNPPAAVPEEIEVNQTLKRLQNTNTYINDKSSYTTTKTVVSEDYSYFQFRCLRYFDTCSGLKYNGIPSSLFLDFLKKYDISPISSKKYPHSIKYYFYADEKIFKVFKQFKDKEENKEPNQKPKNYNMLGDDNKESTSDRRE